MNSIIGSVSDGSRQTAGMTTPQLALSKDNIGNKDSDNTQQVGPSVAPFDPVVALLRSGHWGAMTPSRRARWLGADDRVDFGTRAAEASLVPQCSEKEDATAFLFTKELEPLERKMKEVVHMWTRKDGSHIAISDMTDTHLANAAKLLAKIVATAEPGTSNRYGDIQDSTVQLSYLREEMGKRGIVVEDPLTPHFDLEWWEPVDWKVCNRYEHKWPGKAKAALTTHPCFALGVLQNKRCSGFGIGAWYAARCAGGCQPLRRGKAGRRHRRLPVSAPRLPLFAE